MSAPKWDSSLPEKAKLAWEKALDAEKELALKQATQFLETLPWKGEKVDPMQSLAWPRKGVFRKDGSPVLVFRV